MLSSIYPMMALKSTCLWILPRALSSQRAPVDCWAGRFLAMSLALKRTLSCHERVLTESPSVALSDEIIFPGLNAITSL
jgi:hypothetical protein